MLTEEKKHRFQRSMQSSLFDSVSQVQDNLFPTTNNWSSLVNLWISFSRLFFRKTLHINDNIKQSLATIGISTFQDFINFSAGQLVSRSSKRPVRTLDLNIAGQTKKYFLKQVGTQSPYVRLKAWYQLQPLHSETVQELLVTKLFCHHGIPVMTPVAWGTHTVLGWPVRGFLLIEEVLGREFTEVYRTASLHSRRLLMRAHGELMGTLHQKGIDSKVHTKDLMCISQDYTNFRKCLVVIDRERGVTDLVNISLIKQAKRLAEIWIKGAFMLGTTERSELLAFLSGYWAASLFPSKGKDIRKRFIALIMGRAADILKNDHRFAPLRFPFKKKYDIPLKSIEERLNNESQVC